MKKIGVGRTLSSFRGICYTRFRINRDPKDFWILNGSRPKNIYIHIYKLNHHHEGPTYNQMYWCVFFCYNWRLKPESLFCSNPLGYYLTTSSLARCINFYYLGVVTCYYTYACLPFLCDIIIVFGPSSKHSHFILQNNSMPKQTVKLQSNKRFNDISHFMFIQNKKNKKSSAQVVMPPNSKTSKVTPYIGPIQNCTHGTWNDTQINFPSSMKQMDKSKTIMRH